MDTLQQLGLALVQALQTLSPALDGPMRFFSLLGGLEFYLLIIPLLYWVIDSSLGLHALLVLLVADLFTSGFKLAFHQPRPYWLGGVKTLAQETSYGLPSAHASDSLAVWGYLANRSRRAWPWLLAGALVFCIGLSRVYLGVHFPHDVIGGWLLGGAVLVGLVMSAPQIAAWAARQTLSWQIGAGLAVSVAVIVAGQLIQAFIAGMPDPAAWSAFAAQARTPADWVTRAGALFGVIAGYSLMQRRARFQSGGPWPKRGGRYGLGIIGLVLIYLGLGYVFARIALGPTVGYGLLYIRYAATTFWATFLAPWVFLKVKLADPRP